MELVEMQDGNLAGAEIDGKYELLEEIGSGAVGTVYRARHMALEKVVAIKLLQPSLRDDDDFQQRFEREAKILSNTECQHVVKFFEWGYWRQNDRPYLVTEFLEGESLAQWTVGGKIPWETAFEVGIQTCLGLEAIHTNGAVHRDLSTNNVFIEKTESYFQVKVIDLGLSFLRSADDRGRLTQTGVLLGSLHYMSPEACSGGRVTPASDVYSLGCIIYELIAGRRAFEATEPLSLIFKQTTKYPEPLSQHANVAAHVEDIVYKSLQKRSEDRYETAREFREDLERALRGLPPVTANLSWSKKKTHLVAPYIVAMIVLTGVVLLTALASRPLSPGSIKDQAPINLQSVLRKAYAHATEADPSAIRIWQSEIKGLIKNMPLAEPARRMQAYLVLVLLELSLYEKTNRDAIHLEIAREYGQIALACVSNEKPVPNRAQSVPYEMLARIAIKCSDYQEAVRFYELALDSASRELPPDFVLENDLPGASEPQGLSSKYMFELARCYERCGEYKKAEQSLRQCIASALNSTNGIREPRVVRFTVGPRGAMAALQLSLLMRKCGRASEMKKIIHDIESRYQEEDEELLFEHGRDASFYAVLAEAAVVSGDLDSGTRLYAKAFPALHDNQLADVGKSLNELRQQVNAKNRADLLPAVDNLQKELNRKLLRNQLRKT